MSYPRGAANEYCVRAMDLDYLCIGRVFALPMDGYVLYGKIGALRVFKHHVLLTLADVPGEDIHLRLDEEVFFFDTREISGPGAHLQEVSRAGAHLQAASRTGAHLQEING